MSFTIIPTTSINRPDLKKEKYLRSGFSVKIPKNQLLKTSIIEIEVVSSNGKYILQPEVLNISK